MDLLSKIFPPKPSEADIQIKLEEASYEELVLESQRLGALQEQIKERRRILAALAESQLRKGR